MMVEILFTKIVDYKQGKSLYVVIENRKKFVSKNDISKYLLYNIIIPGSTNVYKNGFSINTRIKCIKVLFFIFNGKIMLHGLFRGSDYKTGQVLNLKLC